MEQLSLFFEEKKTAIVPLWHLYVDGAARNNPGPAGAGIYIVYGHKALCKKGFFLGNKTNNQAEYLALIIGLYLLQNELKFKSDDHIHIFSDSLLLVRQVAGAYKIRNPHIILLHRLALHLLTNLNFEISHVMREKNGVADKAANEGIDKKIALPEALIILCKQYDIEL
jgi:ribonuclease HI